VSTTTNYFKTRQIFSFYQKLTFIIERWDINKYKFLNNKFIAVFYKKNIKPFSKDFINFITVETIQ